MGQVTLVFECVQEFCSNRGAQATEVIPIRENGFYAKSIGLLCSFCSCEPELVSAKVVLPETVDS